MLIWRRDVRAVHRSDAADHRPEQELARERHHHDVGPEHLLLGLVADEDAVGSQVLRAMDSLDEIRQRVYEIIGEGQGAPTGHITFTPRARRVLELALREALQLGHNHIGTGHILLGLIREGDGVAVQVLVRLGADLNRTRQQVIVLLHSASDLRARPSTRNWPGSMVTGPLADTSCWATAPRVTRDPAR
jgi:ATP-dependent Clp protease ATP-binding subunit ClpC